MGGHDQSNFLFAIAQVKLLR